ncbi:rho GTPase-activating protein SYDE2 isoform X2 [Sceloporus undulatus]|uniref:rho GTPase-activating protein SYDE2 isoform X2 n=1 Tax=Sceloporus undulatus TaxID=8520 RepID=UPI001C4DB7EB|nr:rho GTPase-activating protein SYDE2 isoform X2 [Sceloporus undulatus]
MADPLRRTLSRLRGRRGAEGDGRLLRRGKAPGSHGATAGKRGQEGPRQPSSTERAPPFSPGSQQQEDGQEEDQEEEEEDGDYYDNQRLLLGGGGWGCGARQRAAAVGSSSASSSSSISAGDQARLRIQLQEAYCLLLRAMHDLPPASAPREESPLLGIAPGDPSFPCCPRRKGLSRSLGSLPGASSSSSSSSSSPGPQPPRASRRRCGSLGARLPPPTAAREEASVGSREGAPLPTAPSPSPSPPPPPPPSLLPKEAYKPPAALTVRKLQKWMYKGRLLSLALKGRPRDPSPPPPPPPPPPPKGPLWKGPGTPLGSQEGPPSPAASSSTGQGHKAHKDQRILLTDLIENVYIPSVSRRELKTFKATEGTECRPRFASITVSKKRNWLRQSSPRVSNLEKGNAYKKMSGESPHALKFPSPLLEPKMSQTFSKKLLGHESPKRSVSSLCAAENGTSPLTLQNPALDSSEDNDADDEGEIWYNPIPEDDEPDFACFLGGNVDRSDSQVVHYKLSSGNCLVKVAGHNEHLPHFSSSAGRDVSQVDCVHSMELLQVHKPKPTCSILTGFVTDDCPTLKVTLGGPGGISSSKPDTGTVECSPPSPNPLKKGGSINWSFPDKIKSPRTVRKLSMKMKKLPELSRKLSIKGNSSHNSSDNSSLLKHNCQDMGHAALSSSGNMVAAAASRNVISRYHLDSSVSSQHSYKKKSNRSSKSSSKGGYLSDGDSPELIAKSGKHTAEGRAGKGKEGFLSNNGTKTEIDIDAFRHYSFSDQPKCSQYISGLMSIHFYGAEDLKPPRMDSKDVFCAIQVDSVNKARTALLTCRTTFLDMDHTFNIEIENAQHLKLVVFSWEPMPRKNRVCCHGTVVLPALFRVTKNHQLAVKLEPRGLIYVKLTLLEQWENSLNGLDGEREPVMFGIEARKVVEKENVGLMVPLLMKKCIMEIEKRGCQVVGLYRLCGSAAVKKELREAFEKDSKVVTLCENQYPDINVITGVLKDYLRELPSPLITKQLYEAVLEAMVKKPLKMTTNGCENDPRDSEHTVALLDCLPDVEKLLIKLKWPR